MLKGIDPRLSPELLFELAKMGHGQTLVVVDRNFPAYAAGLPVVNTPGLNAPEAIEAICSVMPLDTFVEAPLAAMSQVGTTDKPEVTAQVHAVANQADERQVNLRWVERFAFYDEARAAAFIVATGESRPYACYILTKGVWPSFTPPSA